MNDVFTSWVVMMADSWHASIRAAEKTHQLCGASGLLSLLNRRLVSVYMHAWYTLVVETSLYHYHHRRSMATGNLLRIANALIKYIAGRWFQAFRLQRKGNRITQRSLVGHSFLHLRSYAEDTATQRRLADGDMHVDVNVNVNVDSETLTGYNSANVSELFPFDPPLLTNTTILTRKISHTARIHRKHHQRLAQAFATWTRKAKIFSHISDLASLSCRVLVNLSRAPHLVTVTNLKPR